MANSDPLKRQNKNSANSNAGIKQESDSSGSGVSSKSSNSNSGSSDDEDEDEDSDMQDDERRSQVHNIEVPVSVVKKFFRKQDCLNAFLSKIS